MTAKTTKATKKTRTIIRNSKAVVAVIYIILGIAVALAAFIAIVLMWVSGDFLVGISATTLNWWIRKVLYIDLIIIIGAGMCLTRKGVRYLERRRRR